MTSKWISFLAAGAAMVMAPVCFANQATTQPSSATPASDSTDVAAASEQAAPPTTNSTMRIRLYVPPVSAIAGKTYSVVAEIVNDGPEECVLNPQSIESVKNFQDDKKSDQATQPSDGWKLILLYQNPTNVADSHSVQTQVPPRTVTIPARQSVLLKVELPANYLQTGDNLVSAVLQYSGTQIAGTDLIGIHCIASTGNE